MGSQHIAASPDASGLADDESIDKQKAFHRLMKAMLWEIMQVDPHYCLPKRVRGQLLVDLEAATFGGFRPGSDFFGPDGTPLLSTIDMNPMEAEAVCPPSPSSPAVMTF